MAIKYDSLPSKKPVLIIPEGTYLAEIEEAAMKQGRDITKPEYLNMRYAICDTEGKKIGTIFDSQFDSEASLIKYKIGRFIRALNIDIKGEFELKDLAKIVIGKKFIVDVVVESKEGQQDRSIVDLFSGEVYYPLSEAKEIFGKDIESVETEKKEATEEVKATEATEDDEDLEF